MDKSPVTDKTLGIFVNREESFADIRQRATDDYRQRQINKKKEKKISLNLPVCKPGDLVVLSTQERKNKQYLLVEILDFSQTRENLFHKKYDFEYFGVVIKTTSESLESKVGRLICFNDYSSYFATYKLEKCHYSKVMWLEDINKLKEHKNELFRYGKIS